MSDALETGSPCKSATASLQTHPENVRRALASHMPDQSQYEELRTQLSTTSAGPSA